MVEMRNNSQEKNETPAIITVSMILEDLENGEDRNAIKEKYGLQTWEVKQMFEHPSLKGKKAKKVRRLSFNFVDDTNPDVLPGQVDIEDAIADAEEEAERTSMKDAMIDEINGRQEMDAQDQLQEVILDEDTSEEWQEIEEDTIDQYNEQDY